MGGDHAPQCIIEAADYIAQTHIHVNFKLVGDKKVLTKLIERYPSLKPRAEIIHAASIVENNDQPMHALRKGKHSSMRLAIDLVKSGEVDACVSGGNTGALMMMSNVVLGNLPGIQRPAIISLFPHVRGFSVMLDLGANAECEPSHLVQFALMGACFARAVLKKENPSIGLLNIGEEEIKGRDLERKTYTLLKESALNFMGNVEGHDITKGSVDVVVTDGFSGNIALKTAEGVATICSTFMKDAFRSSLRAKIGGLLASSALKITFRRMDPRAHNGAMFIGINGIVVKSHGSSDSYGVRNAIEVAINLAQKEVNQRIAEELTGNYIKETSQAKGFMSKIKRRLGMD
jgi:glycerol-3-phosphate acyltransferase PlsX